MTATKALTLEQIAAELDRIRVKTIAAKQHDFPAIPYAELEDAYGNIGEAALRRAEERGFATVGELAGWVHEALRHDAIDITRSSRFRTDCPLPDAHEQAISAFASPEDTASGREARELLHEFLAELTDTDRRIGYLHLDPDHDWKPRRIAAALDLPTREVTKTLDRIGVRLRRFAALAVSPGALCARRRRDVLNWQKTGGMPLALKLHLRRCHSCGCELREAQHAVRHAILPLIPAGTLPIAATGGTITGLLHTAAAHPATTRAHDTLTRIRKAAPVGGGGTAAVLIKVTATTAVIGAAALHAVTSNNKPVHVKHHPIAHKTADTTTQPPTPPQSTTTAAATQPTPTPIPATTPANTAAAAQTTTTQTTPPAPDRKTPAPAPDSGGSATPSNAHPAASTAPAPGSSSSSSSSGSSGASSAPPPGGGAPPP